VQGNNESVKQPATQGMCHIEVVNKLPITALPRLRHSGEVANHAPDVAIDLNRIFIETKGGHALLEQFQ
jgi:hypothetical protein